MSAVLDTRTNLDSEVRMVHILEKKLENKDYPMSSTSAAKRGFSDSSMANDPSTSTNSKRTADDR